MENFDIKVFFLQLLLTICSIPAYMPFRQFYSVGFQSKFLAPAYSKSVNKNDADANKFYDGSREFSAPPRLLDFDANSSSCS